MNFNYLIVNKKIRYVFVFIFILSVFSLTVQASIINFCKENKAFVKNQNQQNQSTEEEEETIDNDESPKEVEYLQHYYFSFTNQASINFKWYNLHVNLSSSTVKIAIPPPKK